MELCGAAMKRLASKLCGAAMKRLASKLCGAAMKRLAPFSPRRCFASAHRDGLQGVRSCPAAGPGRTLSRSRSTPGPLLTAGWQRPRSNRSKTHPLQGTVHLGPEHEGLLRRRDLGPAALEQGKRQLLNQAGHGGKRWSAHCSTDAGQIRLPARPPAPARSVRRCSNP